VDNNNPPTGTPAIMSKDCNELSLLDFTSSISCFTSPIILFNGPGLNKAIFVLIYIGESFAVCPIL
jgi:hypothetical protein